MTELTTATIEQRLVASLAKDRSKPSMRRGFNPDDGTVIYGVSGSSLGLAIALSDRTGEDVDHILDRMAKEYA